MMSSWSTISRRRHLYTCRTMETAATRMPLMRDMNGNSGVLPRTFCVKRSFIHFLKTIIAFLSAADRFGTFVAIMQHMASENSHYSFPTAEAAPVGSTTSIRASMLRRGPFRLVVAMVRGISKDECNVVERTPLECS
eukprot:COSAG02_NODE_3338_length_6903_cov_13.687537_3_plen_137_part_00